MAFLSDFLFTLCAQRDAPTYTKLEWLFYRIFLFILRTLRDAPTYTSTIDQCGARSGSPQLKILKGSRGQFKCTVMLQKVRKQTRNTKIAVKDLKV